MTDKDIIKGLECLSGRSKQEHFRIIHKYGKNPCENCVYHYNSKYGKTTCTKLVCKDSLNLIKTLYHEEYDVIYGLECLAGIRHKEPSRNYAAYKEECLKCKYKDQSPYCNKSICEDVLKLIEGAKENESSNKA